VLGGAFTGVSEGRRGLGWNQPYVEEHRPQFEAYQAFCDKLGEQPDDVALAWLLHQPAVTAPIVARARSTSSPPASAPSRSTSPDALRRLDTSSQTPELGETLRGLIFGDVVAVGDRDDRIREPVEELLPDVLEGRIEPGDRVPDGYRAMADRESIKVMVTP
jgi:hypothetical protein